MLEEDKKTENTTTKSFQAFMISLFRAMIEYPEIALYLDNIYKNKVPDYENSEMTWKDFYDSLHDPSCKEKVLFNIDQEVSDIDWNQSIQTYTVWGQYGWITDNSFTEIGFWDHHPISQKEADVLVLKKINKVNFAKLIHEILEFTTNTRIFNEAYTCFNEKHYTACASLLISLIDSELINSSANTNFDNIKTGSSAGKRVYNNALQAEHNKLPGLFNLELINFKAVVDTLFENANGFKNEPEHINRNYLQHGMSKRKVLRKDCIKLFLLYHKTLMLFLNDSKKIKEPPYVNL